MSKIIYLDYSKIFKVPKNQSLPAKEMYDNFLIEYVRNSQVTSVCMNFPQKKIFV